ncbi:HPP-domain-containing protein, partial [Ascobolus immersus RN42]
PYIPRPRLYLLPRPISRFLGYREPGTEIKTKDATIWFWGFIGAFVGIACVEGIFMNIGGRLAELGVPMVIGSFGATAILLFNSLDSPLSQPRNVLLGQLLSALTGISITKLFLLSSRFDDLVWLVGAISCATALVVMAVTKTTHPPAGATALIAAVDVTCRRLGWWYLTAVLLSAVVMLAVALIIDNIRRRYPVYWWTPV